MSNFDYFKQYVSEQERIRQKIRDEENPYHQAHIQEFDAMIDEKIKTQVPALIQQYNEAQRVNVKTYLNGKPIANGDIVKGVREMLINALKHPKRGR